MKPLYLLLMFVLTASIVAAYNADYSKNGYGVPGYIPIIISDAQNLATPVSNRNVPAPEMVNPAVYYRNSPYYTTAVLTNPWEYRGGTSVPKLQINPFDRRADSVYIGQYGLSQQYIKTYDPKRWK